MNKLVAILILCLALVLSLESSVGAEDSGRTYPVMHPDPETLEKWIEDYNTAPIVQVEMKEFGIPSPTGSQNLLSHLKYTPYERDQGWCGNCWAWAGTGIMEIALDVQNGKKDRLSIQYLNSNYNDGNGSGWACCGGDLVDLANFYDNADIAIPWSNTNAGWQDGSRRCEDELTGVPAGTISTTPNYSISSILDVKIRTQDVTKATAIANIKNVLNQNKAVWFAFVLPNDDAWGNFTNFWIYSAESDVYDIDQFCGIPYLNGAAHAVLCVGYDDTNPANSYWIMLNSWGTTLKRPNGLFRVNMDMAYDGVNLPYYSFYWETLDVSFGATSIVAPTVTTTAATLVEETTATLNGLINNDGGESCQYRFGYSTTPGGPYTYTAWSADNRTTGQPFSQAIFGLAKGTKYYFRAQARNSAGTGSGLEQTLLTKPDAPSSFSANATGISQINLSWVKGGGAQKTKIQRKQGGYPANRNDGIQIYFGAGTNVSNTGLTPGTTYYYRAWSYVQGSEQWSDSYAQTLATTGTAINNPPNTPSNPSPLNHTNNVSINVDLSWTGGDPDAGDNVTYDVYFGTNATPPLVSNDQLATTYDPGTLNYNTKYYWKVVATDNHGATIAGPVWDFGTRVPEIIAWNCPLGDQALIAPNPGAGRPELSVPANCAEITASAGAQLWGIYYLVETGPQAGTWLWYIPGFATSTLTQLEQGNFYFVIVSGPCTLTIPQ